MTDLLKSAITSNLEMHRVSLDGAAPSQLTIIVNFDERTGMPRKVTMKPEWIHYAKDGRGQSA